MRSTITRRSSHSRNVRSAARVPAVKEKQDALPTITYLSLSLSPLLSLFLSSNTTPPLSRFTDKSIATAKLPVEIPRYRSLLVFRRFDVSVKAGNDDRGVFPPFP